MRMDTTFLERQGVAKLESDAISLSSGGLILIAVAAAGVVLGFFGCCGAAKESRCMLGIVSYRQQGQRKVRLVRSFF